MQRHFYVEVGSEPTYCPWCGFEFIEFREDQKDCDTFEVNWKM